MECGDILTSKDEVSLFFLKHHTQRRNQMNKKKSMQLITIICALTVSFMLSACQAKGTCDLCGEKAKLWEFTTEGSFGLFGTELASDSKTLNVCKDCLDLLIKEAEESEPGFGETVTYTYHKKEK